MKSLANKVGTVLLVVGVSVSMLFICFGQRKSDLTLAHGPTRLTQLWGLGLASMKWSSESRGRLVVQETRPESGTPEES